MKLNDFSLPFSLIIQKSTQNLPLDRPGISLASDIRQNLALLHSLGKDAVHGAVLPRPYDFLSLPHRPHTRAKPNNRDEEGCQSCGFKQPLNNLLTAASRTPGAGGSGRARPPPAGCLRATLTWPGR